MHSLDNPTWKSLTTHQSQLALVAGMARRFPPEICIHGAIGLPLPPAYQDLARLSPEPVGLFTLQKLQPRPGWKILRAVELLQMVHGESVTGESLLESGSSGTTAADNRLVGGFQIKDLTPADLPAMSALYEATRPGRKLSPGLHKLGGFIGLRAAGADGKAQLVAMACLRLHMPGFREISTVGTQPGFEGRGYATALVAELVRRIRARDEQPYLTVRTDNERAIAIYKRLGFRERVKMHSTTIQVA